LILTVFAFGYFVYVFLLLKAKNVGQADDAAIFLYVIFYAMIDDVQRAFDIDITPPDLKTAAL